MGLIFSTLRAEAERVYLGIFPIEGLLLTPKRMSRIAVVGNGTLVVSDRQLGNRIGRIASEAIIWHLDSSVNERVDGSMPGLILFRWIFH